MQVSAAEGTGIMGVETGAVRPHRDRWGRVDQFWALCRNALRVTPDLSCCFIESGRRQPIGHVFILARNWREPEDLTSATLDRQARKSPRKGGPAITALGISSVINKTDLAPYVARALRFMARDARRNGGSVPVCICQPEGPAKGSCSQEN